MTVIVSFFFFFLVTFSEVLNIYLSSVVHPFESAVNCNQTVINYRIV